MKDDIGAIVAEFGNYTTKMGFAGEDFPRALFRSDVALLGGELKYDLSKPYEKNENYRLYNPIDNDSGLLDVEEKDDELPLYTHMMKHGLKTSLYSSNLDSHPLIFVEKSYNTPSKRQRITEILFEKFKTPALFLAKDAVLSCYACGRTTSAVVDIGSLGSTVTPVYEGFVENKGILRSPVGGRAMDNHMLQILDKLYNEQEPGVKKELKPKEPNRSPDFYKLARLDMARICKETVASTASLKPGYDPSSIDPQYVTMQKHPIELPDGTILDIGHERFSLAESLFGKHETASQKREEIFQRIENSSCCKDENTLGNTGLPEISLNAIQNLVCDAVFKCDRDQQAHLLGNIVLCGGGSCISALPDRLRDEVESIIHTHTPGWRVKVLSPGIQERAVCSWVGGSILGSLGSFHDMYMTKKEYEEHGPALVNRKCP